MSTVQNLKNTFDDNCKKLENGLRVIKVDASSEDRLTNLKLILTMMKKNVF